MYDEDTFSRHIFWMKFKRIFLLILFSIIGCAIGIFLSEYLIELLLWSQNIRIPIIAGATLIMFFLTLFSTSKINKDIQDGYWKIAVLRKLTLISKKLDSLEGLDKLNGLDKLEKLERLEDLSYLKSLDSNVSQTLEEMKKAPQKTVRFTRVSKKEKPNKKSKK